jgi:hypothetical protein
MIRNHCPCCLIVTALLVSCAPAGATDTLTREVEAVRAGLRSNVLKAELAKAHAALLSNDTAQAVAAVDLLIDLRAYGVLETILGNPDVWEGAKSRAATGLLVFEGVNARPSLRERVVEQLRRSLRAMTGTGVAATRRRYQLSLVRLLERIDGRQYLPAEFEPLLSPEFVPGVLSAQVAPRK